jgi:hypothetical protein
VTPRVPSRLVNWGVRRSVSHTDPVESGKPRRALFSLREFAGVHKPIIDVLPTFVLDRLFAALSAIS